jgi:hypothetical protein
MVMEACCLTLRLCSAAAGTFPVPAILAGHYPRGPSRHSMTAVESINQIPTLVRKFNRRAQSDGEEPALYCEAAHSSLKSSRHDAAYFNE